MSTQAKHGGASTAPNEHNLLEIITNALQYDFAPTLSTESAAQLLPTQVLIHLTQALGADGGNLSIWMPTRDVLSVRAWHHRANGTDNYDTFRSKMENIGADPLKRAQSSTYRCLDSGSTVNIQASELDNPSNCTLDLDTLEPRKGSAALAVPLIFHGRPMGVIHLDKAEPAGNAFSEHDARFVEQLARLMPSIIYNVLMIEAITKIKALVAAFNEMTEGQVHSDITKILANALFVPNALLFWRHPTIDRIFELKGDSGTAATRNVAEKMNRLDLRDRDDEITTFITEKSRRPAPQETTADKIFQGAISPYPCLLATLSGDGTRSDGFIVTFDQGETTFTTPYVRLTSFFAEFTMLSIEAIAQMERRSRVSHGAATHELIRHVNELSNTSKRMIFVSGVLRRIVPRATPGNLADELYALNHQVQAISRALKYQVSTTASTLKDRLASPRVAARIDVPDVISSDATLRTAVRRHSEYESGGIKQPLRLREAIEDILNSYTKRMSDKNVRWVRGLSDLPQEVLIERNNFALVFGNLAENAVKYSRPGTKITVDAETDDYSVSLMITNTGPHIDMRGYEATDIFASEYRGLAAQKLAEGQGEGLWQAKQVANLWGDGNSLRLVRSDQIDNDGSIRWSLITFELLLPYTPAVQRWFASRR